MAIGERIRYIRNLRGMTQKYLGRKIGFVEKTADVRMAQYEAGSRTPKEKMTADIAHVLGVSPEALTVPDIDSYIGLAHTLFALEDIYGLKINSIDGELCLTLDKYNSKSYQSLFEIFSTWHEEAEKLKEGEISQEEYNDWRYTYPRIEAKRTKTSLDEKRKNKDKAEVGSDTDTAEAAE